MAQSVFSFLILFIFLLPLPAGAQDLSLSADDLLIELRADGGYHLFIRFKPDISSVLITESTRDPTFLEPNYAYRAAEWNAVNGDETRIIDGIPLAADSRIFSLVSSTPVRHPDLDWAYHIYIPHVIMYGYEGGRYGEVHVGDGTYLNIRAFYYAFADYRGPFQDNPFVLRVTQEVERVSPEITYMPETVRAFFEIAGDNTVFATDPADMFDIIVSIMEEEKGNDVDIVVVLDVTGSMRPYFDEIRQNLVPTLQEMVAEYESFRIGMVFFKDYFDDFLNRVFPFTTDFAALQRNINTVRVGGGGDIPEAVFEALYAGATRLSWEAENRIMILIGDAPPHPRPRRNITKAMMDSEVANRNIELHAIILPN